MIGPKVANVVAPITRAEGVSVGGSVIEIAAVVTQVDRRTTDLEPCSDAELRRQGIDLRQRVGNGEPLDSVLPAAFGLVREAARRTVGQPHVDVQVMAGAALHRGAMVEMHDGEGKTLAVTLPAYLNALAGGGVHLATISEHHARHAADSMRPLYQLLGVDVGVLAASHNRSERTTAYRADVTYGRFGQFLADHLRDGRAKRADREAQRGLRFAIVDEADHVLIDYPLHAWLLPKGDDLTGPVTEMFVGSYFRLYDKLAGLTATAAAGAAEVAELRRSYGLEVVEIPPGRPVRRVDHPDTPYSTLVEALPEIVSCVRAHHETGQPVLVGTVSATVARHVSRFLRDAEIDHELLDVSEPGAGVETDGNIDEVASVLGQAGRLGAVTVLAGEVRGVDIPLGGVRPSGGPAPDGEHEAVVERGGLLVIGAERDRWSRRRDDRLAAWAGRRGEPGESRFIFRNDGVTWRYGFVDIATGAGVAFRRWARHPTARSAPAERIARAQAEQQARHLEQRRGLLDLVELVEEQRRAWYARRRRTLTMAADQLDEATSRLVGTVTGAGEAYESRRGGLGDEDWVDLVRRVWLETFDQCWRAHLGEVQRLHDGLDDVLRYRTPARRQRQLVAQARQRAERHLEDIELRLDATIVASLLQGE